MYELTASAMQQMQETQTSTETLMDEERIMVAYKLFVVP